MSTLIRMPSRLRTSVLDDLRRPHAFAFERVGFLFGFRASADETELLLLSSYAAVDDANYEVDTTVCARIGARAISAALQRSLDDGAGTFHVHTHLHVGRPSFSRIDLRELPPILEPFRALVPDQPHGMLLLSEDDCIAVAWLPGAKAPTPIDAVTFVGSPMVLRGKR